MENTTTAIFFSSNITNNNTDFLNKTITHVKQGNVQLKLYDILIPALASIILICNFAIVISSGLILRANYQPKTTYLFLGNVAFADLITGIAVVIGQYYPKEDRNQAICELLMGMIVSSTVSSVWSVGLIAIDRYLYIAHGIKYKIWMYPFRARILILCTWILGLIVGFLPAMGWSNPVQIGKKTICWFIILAPKGLVLLTTLIGFLPIVFVVILYSNILIKAQRKVRQLNKSDKMKSAKKPDTNVTSGEIRLYRGGKTSEASNQTNKKSSSMGVSKWKAIKVVAFTTGSFVCTWVPYFVSCTIYVFFCNNETCKQLRFAIASPLWIMGFLNSFLNPFIYAWWHNGFRQFVKKICCGTFIKKKENKTSTSMSSNTRCSSITSSSTSGKNKVNFKCVELHSEKKLVENTKL